MSMSEIWYIRLQVLQVNCYGLQFMVALFVSHVRPILDYCSCIWNIGYVSDLTLLETIQRRWTKKGVGFNNLSYSERLRSLNLFSIKGRLLHSDLIKYWKIACCSQRVLTCQCYSRGLEKKELGVTSFGWCCLVAILI